MAAFGMTGSNSMNLSKLGDAKSLGDISNMSSLSSGAQKALQARFPQQTPLSAKANSTTASTGLLGAYAGFGAGSEGKSAWKSANQQNQMTLEEAFDFSKQLGDPSAQMQWLADNRSAQNELGWNASPADGYEDYLQGLSSQQNPDGSFVHTGYLDQSVMNELLYQGLLSNSEYQRWGQPGGLRDQVDDARRNDAAGKRIPAGAAITGTNAATAGLNLAEIGSAGSVDDISNYGSLSQGAQDALLARLGNSNGAGNPGETGSGGSGADNETGDQSGSGSGLAPDSVSGQLNNLLSKENPLMQRAYYKGLDLANSRGLLNSSMASEAAQAAMMDVALPIAQTDASWNNEFGMQNLRHAQEQENMRLADSITQTQMQLQNALGQGDMVLAQELQSLLNEQQYQFQAGQAELDRLLQILLAEQQYGSIGTDVSWDGGQNPSSVGSGSGSSGASAGSSGSSSGEDSGGGLLGDAWKQSENYKTINHYYNTVLGRDVLRAGFDYWNDQLNQGMGVSEFRARLEDSDEAKGIGSEGASSAPPPSISGSGPYTEYLPEGFEPNGNVSQLSYRLREHVKALGNPELSQEESLALAEKIIAGDVSVWEVV